MNSTYSGMPREKGFSLLEVLVAFTILAISLGLLMQSFSTSVRGLTLSEEHTKAYVLAESMLAEVGVTQALEQGVLQGAAENGFYWRLTIDPYVSTLDGPMAEGLVPYLVQVSVGKGEGDEPHREVRLSTLQLAIIDADQDESDAITQTQ